MAERNPLHSGRGSTAAILWTAFTAGLLLAPLPQDLSRWEGSWRGPIGLDKLVHVVLFFCLSRAWLRARRAGGRNGIATRVVTVSAYGGLLELLQSGLATRSAEWGDLLADSVGAALAIWAVRGPRESAAAVLDPVESNAP